MQWGCADYIRESPKWARAGNPAGGHWTQDIPANSAGPTDTHRPLVFPFHFLGVKIKPLFWVVSYFLFSTRFYRLWLRPTNTHSTFPAILFFIFLSAFSRFFDKDQKHFSLEKIIATFCSENLNDLMKTNNNKCTECKWFYKKKIYRICTTRLFFPRGEPRLELGVHVFGIMWNSLYNAPSSIVFYLEMKVEVEVGVHDIRSRFTPRFFPYHLLCLHSFI